jgi:arginase family enzyme
MPEPGGMTVLEAEALLRRVALEKPVAGAGLTGLAPAPANAEPLTRLTAALGL